MPVLPPALIRSGRIELWLETRLPDPNARREILCQRIRRLIRTQPDADRARPGHEGVPLGLKSIEGDEDIPRCRERRILFDPRKMIIEDRGFDAAFFKQCHRPSP